MNRLDELPHYLLSADGEKIGNITLADLTIAFIMNLVSSVAASRNTMLIMTLTAKQQLYETYSERIRKPLKTLNNLRVDKLVDNFKEGLSRQVQFKSPVDKKEIYEVVRKRLVKSVDDRERKRVVNTFCEFYADKAITTDPDLRNNMLKAYPFHSFLLDVLYERVASIDQFNRTRGILRLLSLVLHNIYKNKVTCKIVSTSDIQLDDVEIAEELTSRIDRTDFKTVIESDCIKKSRVLDEKRNIKIFEKIATTIYLYSMIGTTKISGIRPNEISVAVSQPDFDPSLVDDALQQMDKEFWYLKRNGAEYYFDKEPQINKIIYDYIQEVKHSEIVNKIRETLLSLIIPQKGIKVIMWDREKLVDDENLKIFVLDFNERVTDENEKDKSLAKNPHDIKVLDPFAGAGNLIFEAKEIGLNCTAIDYNPVAYLIMKSVLDYPSRYGLRLAEDVEKYGKEVIRRTRDEIGKFYSRVGRKSLAYIWSWCIRCPYCSQRIPLTNHSWLVKNNKRKVGMRFVPNDLDFKVEIVNDMADCEGNRFTQRSGKAICLKCSNAIDYKNLSRDIAEKKDRELIAVVVKAISGKDYELPTKEDKLLFMKSTQQLKDLWSYFEEEGLIPNEEIRASHRRENLLWHYGIRRWNQFFSSRQLLVMLTVLKNIRLIGQDIPDPHYAKAISTYLAFLLCKHVDYNSIGIRWHTSYQVIGDALSFRRPSMTYNHAEVNPFEKTSGSLLGMLKDIVDAVKFSSTAKEQCEIKLDSVLHLSSKIDKKYDLIVTDPPYSDDVQYAELSEFFYIWLYRALKNYYPELPRLISTNDDISVAWGRFGHLQPAKDFYERAMKQAFHQLYGSLKDDGLLVLFFAHSSTEAWNLLLEVLRESRFRVVSSYAVHTENILNIIAKGKTSLMSSIVVACRKKLENTTAYFEDLLPSIEDKIRKLLIGLTVEELLELPMTDLLIMTYGKVLEESTQYNILKSYRSDFVPEFERLIKDSRDFVLKEIVTKLTRQSPNILGSDMSFYIVTKVFYRGVLDSNEALKVGLAYQIDIDDLIKRQVAKKESGITRLLFFDESDFPMKPDHIDKNNLHQQLLYLENIASSYGVAAVKRIMVSSNRFRSHDLVHIINLLIKSYKIRINKKEVLNEKEHKEIRVLESLADIFESSILLQRGTLEKFME